MIQVIFRSLKNSEFVKKEVLERFDHFVDRFPDLKNHLIKVTLAMENSPRHPGPDLFKVKVNINGSRYQEVILEKSSQNIYAAISEVSHRLLERFKRNVSKERMRTIKQKRNLLKNFYLYK